MAIKSLVLLLGVLALCFDFGQSQGAVFEIAKAVYETVKAMKAKYRVVMINNCTNSIYLKCASKDNAIKGKGSNSRDWWTLNTGDVRTESKKLDF